MSELVKLLETLLNIKSPTYQEKNCCHYIHDFFKTHCKEVAIKTHNNSLIAEFKKDPTKKTVAFIGHSDVVPEYKIATINQDKLYGAGASDMKGGVAAFMYLFKTHLNELQKVCNPIFICYAREENTPLTENGLYELIQKEKDVFKNIDLAIVGEPTNSTLQLGCVGSIHMEVIVKGEACHSARPWNGKNALYEALPLISYLANLKPKEQKIQGVSFFDVLSITESESEKGRTSIPGYWKANINYRFSPNHTLKEAESFLIKTIETLNIKTLHYTLTDSVDAGGVINTEFSEKIIKALNVPIEAKQAWTDVAQLTALGIPAFNFGPGRTDQAHKADEYIEISALTTYYQTLINLLQKPDLW